MRVTGWGVWGIGIALPVVGVVLSLLDSGEQSTAAVYSGSLLRLAGQSLGLALAGAVTALVFGLAPGLLLGRAHGSRRPTILGLSIAPLLIPPQVYAYAWDLIGVGPTSLNRVSLDAGWTGGVVYALSAGLVTGTWLWPIAAMIIASGWRPAGLPALRLALIDANTGVAWRRSVLPSMTLYVTVALAVVFAIALIEYPIPHMSQARVCATELQVLVELRASGGQLARTAMTPTLLMAGCMVFAIRHRRRAAAWQALEAEVDESEVGVGTVRLAVLTTIVWLVTVGTPAGALLLRMHDWTSWTSVIGQFSEEWGTSLAVSMGAGILSVLLSMAVVWFPAGSGRSPRVWAWLPVVVAALVPPTILGLGFIAIFNRSAIVQGLYVQTAWVWMLALTARYGLIAMLIAWVTVGRRGIVLAEQARVDGGWPAGNVSPAPKIGRWHAFKAGELGDAIQ